MKLLYIVNDLCVKGGVERILSDVVNYLVKNNDYQIVIATINENTKSAYEYDDRVQIIPVKYTPSNLRYAGKVLDMFSFGKALGKLISEIKPDAVIKVQTSGYSWVIPWVQKSVPKLLWIHTSQQGLAITLKKNQNAVFNYLYWKTCRFFMGLYHKTIMLTEEDMKDWKLNNGVAIYNFTNFENNSGQVSSLNNKNAICVARYDYFKRLDLLVEIWEKIHAKFPDWTLSVYGGYGEERDNIGKLVKSKGLADCIQLNGSTNQIDQKLIESSVFCFTSQFEGFGLVLIEAMQFGLPVVAFSTVGVNTIVKDNNNGYLVRFGDVDTYADKLSSLLESYEERQRLGENARKSLSLFSKEKVMRMWTDLFESLV